MLLHVLHVQHPPPPLAHLARGGVQFLKFGFPALGLGLPRLRLFGHPLGLFLQFVPLRIETCVVCLQASDSLR